MSDRTRSPQPSIPYRVEPTHHAAEIVEGYAGHRPTARRPAVEVTVAGRLMLQRPHGRLAFAMLRDQTGDIQLFALGEGDRPASPS